MAREPKIPQYAEFNLRPGCFGPHQQHGGRLSDWLEPSRPLMVEIGAGRSQISTGFAGQNLDWQVLAVDLKSDRLNKAARQQPPDNLAFLQSDADDLGRYADFLGGVDLIWLAFPDPQDSRRRLKHRLLSPVRLQLWAGLLKPGGCLRLKTDHAGFFADSRQLIDSDPAWHLTDLVDDLGPDGDYPDDVLTQTAYETRFRGQGKPICYLQAQTVKIMAKSQN